MSDNDRTAVRPSFVGAVLWLVLAACESAEPPKAPGPAGETSPSRRRGEIEAIEASDDEEADVGDEVEANLTFDTGGAKVGDSDTQDEVEKCHESKTFFDRFDGEQGKCTKLRLARTDCQLAKIGKLLSSKQRRQLDDAMNGPYEGWVLDQCLDCAKDETSDLCQTKDGDEQVGTKLFFVKEEDAEIRGKALLLPIRRGQA